MSVHKFTVPPSSTIEVEGGGNTLTFAAFSASPGPPGASAYQAALNNGFIGTEAQWLASLQGDGSLLLMQRNAGEALGGHRAVVLSSGMAFYADSSNLDHAGLVVGITTGAAAQGASASIQSGGELAGLSGLIPDQAIFLSTNGGLTQSAPITGFSQQLGIALSATAMLINLTLAIEV